MDLIVPEVSVVVPYYRAQADLDRLLEALAAQEHPAARLQVVIADDGSPEPPVLPAGLPFATVVVRHEDRGFRASAARALGVRAADGAVLAFLDGDMLPEPGYLTAACAAPVRSGQAVVVGRRRHLDARLLEAGDWRPGQPVPEDAQLPDPAWLADAYAQTGDLRRADSTAYRFVISAVLTVARDVYEDAGGFDPSFVGYGGEDWELAHRLWRAGGEFAHEPRAVAWQAGEDFGGREDPAQARRVKNRESMILAPRIAAPTARGLSLGLGGDGADGTRGDGPVGGEDVVRPARVAVRLRHSAGSGLGDAAAVLSADALLQAFPAARLTVAGPLAQDAAACLADPRVRLADAVAEPAPPALPSTDALRAAPDWAVDVLVPVRPSAPGARPAPKAAADFLLELERGGVERVEVTGDDGATLATLTSSRARWREHREGSLPAERTRRIPAADLGWRAVEAEPDLEGWWGGWA